MPHDSAASAMEGAQGGMTERIVPPTSGDLAQRGWRRFRGSGPRRTVACRHDHRSRARHRRRRVHRLSPVPPARRRRASTVVGLDDLSESSADALAARPAVEFVETDLRDQPRRDRGRPRMQTIYHQGAKRSVPRSMDEPALFTEVNVGGTLNVLLAAREAGALVVSASSSSVYGDQSEFPLRESMAPRPRSPYAASKLATEIYCAGLWRSYGVPAVSLRYFNVYGPGQSPESEYAAVVPRFAVACMRGERPVIHGDGEQTARLHLHRRRRRSEPACGPHARARLRARVQHRRRSRAHQREPPAPADRRTTSA